MPEEQKRVPLHLKDPIVDHTCDAFKVTIEKLLMGCTYDFPVGCSPTLSCTFLK